MAAHHAGLPPLDQPTELKLLSFNCGLLSRSYPGGHVCVPDYLPRREHTGRELFSRGYDILLLQEVFEDVDVIALTKAAAEQKYVCYAGGEGRDRHVLMIAVASRCMAGEGKTAQHWFDAQYDVEFSPGPGLKRGFLSWTWRHPAGREICAVCVHTTAFADFVAIRALQARQVGLFVRALPAETLAFVGGDFNAAPYYPTDKWTSAKVVLKDEAKPATEQNVEKVEPHEYSSYWECAVMYFLFLHYSDLVDLQSCREFLSPGTDRQRRSQLGLSADA